MNEQWLEKAHVLSSDFDEKLVILDFTIHSINSSLFHLNQIQIRRECLAARFSAALFDMSYFGKYYLSGADAQKAADWIFTNNVRDGGVRRTRCEYE